MVTIAAVILAGGRGTRLGGANKALLDIGGERFIDRARDALKGCAPVLVSGGASVARLLDGVATVADLDSDYGGPLAGVAAAIAAIGESERDFLVSLAVDTPFFPADFVERAMAVAEGADCVMAAFHGQDYPTNALWRIRAVAGLPAAVLSGEAPHSLKRLAESLRTVRLDYAQWCDDNPFANANTPEELADLRARAAIVAER
jgi:molybdopterin-guanine dinucleotide biosynthesis protein A